jgi:dihydroorotase
MVIQNAIVCDYRGERKVDVQIIDGVITAIGDGLSDDEIVDASGCYLLPGLVDTNVRLKDDGLSRTNLEKLSRRALRGGVCTVVLASDLAPRIDNEITLEFVQQHRHLSHGATIESSVSALNDAGALSNIAIMLKKGCLAIHTSTIPDYNLISRIAQYLQMAKKPLLYTAQEQSIIDSGVMSDGAIASHLGLPGISPLSEVVHVASMIEIARHFEISIVFQSITQPRSVELIANARQEGIAVSCEVAIHHLFKNDSACLGFDTDAKITPPLVDKSKQTTLVEALKTGNIHSLSALHHPNSDIHKDITFYDAHEGTTSIEEYLPLLYTYLLESNIISMPKLLELASYIPSKYIGVDAGVLEIGLTCDCVLFDVRSTTTVEHHHSLYKNETLKGKVVMAICRGEVTYF